MSDWKETLGQTHNALERLHISSGLGMLSYPPGGPGPHGWGEDHLGFLTHYLLHVSCVIVSFISVNILFMLSPCPVTAASTRRCHSIYKGFAQCLMALGDSLTDNARKDEDTHEIHSICRSWDEFHDCANVAMAGCPEEAAAVWESLRQESKKMQFSGNLYDMCSNRNSHPIASVSPHGSPNQEEINQESLRGRAGHFCPHCLMLLSPLLLLLFWI
ncbi:neuritin 1-like a [Scomber japonicus]|uniref:neuritin 1-like a n=1 Tax=Scomber japonicus TaxID=13676 RepID=UPI002305F97B|nr:neuritin 1-like a [Scomber japonicus]